MPLLPFGPYGAMAVATPIRHLLKGLGLPGLLGALGLLGLLGLMGTLSETLTLQVFLSLPFLLLNEMGRLPKLRLEVGLFLGVSATLSAKEVPGRISMNLGSAIMLLIMGTLPLLLEEQTTIESALLIGIILLLDKDIPVIEVSLPSPMVRMSHLLGVFPICRWKSSRASRRPRTKDALAVLKWWDRELSCLLASTKLLRFASLHCILLPMRGVVGRQSWTKSVELLAGQQCLGLKRTLFLAVAFA